jgi:hypothetical protein
MAPKKENENWKFRTFIKGYENTEKLDSIVHRLNKEISSKIDCTTCANCCKAIQPTFTQKAAMIRIHIRTNENIAFKRAFFLLAK